MDGKISKLRRKKESAYANGSYDPLYKYCIEIAELLVENEKYEEALIEYKESEQAGEMCDIPMHIAKANRMIAEVYVMMQKPKDAIRHVRKYLEISRNESDLKEEQRALATLARIYFIQAEDTLPSKEREEALEHAQKYNIKSLKICDRLEGECNVSPKNVGEMRARVYLNLGLVEEATGHLDKAVQHLSKAVMICKSLDLWEELCLSYTNLGLTHKHNGDLSSALKAFDLGLTVARRLSEKEKYMSDLLVQKASILLELPDFRRAKHALHKAYKLKSSAPDDQAEIGRKLKIVAAISEFEEKLIHLSEDDICERRKIYESMGDGCAAVESYKKALEYYHLTLACSEKLGESGKKASDILVSLAQTYKDLKDYDKAVEYYSRELPLWKDNPAEACNTSLSIADVLELNSAPSREIITMYRSALCLARDAKNLKLERTALKSLLAHLNENMNQSMASEIEKELKRVESHLEDQSESGSESEESEETPCIGDHICLETLSDSEVDEDEVKENTRTARRVRGGFQVRRNEKGETPLHVACINGNLTLVTKLLDQGHPVDVRDNNGWLPLHEAANYGYVDIVRELIDRGASINDPGGPHCDGVTPLLDAASCGHFLVMELLLEKGASPTVRTDRGETVLDCLRGWRRRYIEEEHSDLHGETLQDYNTIARKIKLAIEKAGHQVSHESISERSLKSGAIPKANNAKQAIPSNTEARPSKSSRTSRDLSPIISSTVRRRKSNEVSSAPRTQNRSEFPSTSSDRSAVSEYQNAMRGLKNRTVNLEVPVSPIKAPQSALLSAENVVDDWLIDDLDEPATSRPPKRRKKGDDFLTGDQLRKSSNKQTVKTFRQSNSPPVSSTIQYSDSETSDSNGPTNYGVGDSSPLKESSSQSAMDSDSIPDLVHIDADSRLSNVNEASSSLSHQLTNSVQPTIRLSTSRKHQTTLLKAGISREKVRPVIEPITRTAECLPDSTQSSVESVQPPPPSSNTVSQKRHTVKVRIEGKLLLLALPNDPDLTISWLAEETARRYHSMEGAEPKLTLQTVEGALLFPQDPLSLVLDVGSEVHAVVQTWNLASIMQRYREACAASNTDVLAEVEAQLDASQATMCLDLGHFALTTNELLPAFKALAHQHGLQYLRLPGNCLGDSGLKALMDTLVHMTQLRELDLSCCNITHNGLSYMCRFISQNNLFQALEVIDMSFNRLGDECLRQLCSLVSRFPSLHTLRMASVSLSSFTAQQDFYLEQIEVLDLSYNKIGREGVQEILSKLNPDRICSLNFAAVGQSVAREVAIFLGQCVPHNLTHLNLSYCDVYDVEMDQLIECLQMCPKLRNLQLEGNSKLSPSTVKKLCQLQLSQMNLAGVECNLQNLEHTIENLSISVPRAFQTDPTSNNSGRRAPFGFFSNNLSSLLGVR